MNSFVRAHVTREVPSKRDSKTEENMKKQLKNMLYGYKNNDTELIKSSAVSTEILDDSSSVSGYSDLNLTNSSIDEESKVTRSIIVEANNSNVDKINIEMDTSMTTESLDSISEMNDIESLSEDFNIDSLSDKNSSTCSLLHSSEDLESEDSESFDANGMLASKILEKLSISGKLPALGKKLNKTQKRKLEKPINSKPQEAKVDKITKQRRKVTKTKAKDFKSSSENESDTSSCTGILSIGGLNNDDSDDSTIPFVSITADDMPTENLEDVLGYYRHPTVRNLPSESQNYVDSRDNLFETGSMVCDIHVDDIDSLIPEIDEDPKLDDLDLDTTADVSQDAESDSSIESTDPDVTPPFDSTTSIYDNTLETEVSERELSTEPVDTPLVNPVKVYYTKNSCIFIMKHPAEIYIHGKVRIQALGGGVEINGFKLDTNTHFVYAPKYNYAQILKTVEQKNEYYGLFGKLTSQGLSVTEAEDIVTSIGSQDGIVILLPLKSRKLDFVENNFSAADLFNKSSKYVDNYFRKASKVLGCSLYSTKPWKSFDENRICEQALRCGMTQHARGIVCGGKGVGKSTFLRYYINKTLQFGPVLLIDLDPGQPELTVAGNISATVIREPLLGPAFTHLKTPEIMLNLGMINTMDNSIRYATAITSLITQCRENKAIQEMPWIVNTMGMTNALGLKFMSLIILLLRPSFVLQMETKNVKKRFEFPLNIQTIRTLYQKYEKNYMFKNISYPDYLNYSFFVYNVTTSANSNLSLPPREERYLNFLAYFGELINSRNNNLLAVLPYEVSLRDLKVAFNVKIPAESASRVINGKIVALCECSSKDERSIFTLGEKSLLCHGHGIVRGIDLEKGSLYMITPVGEKLSKVNTIVYADWVPELRNQEQQLPPGTLVPYRTASFYQRKNLMVAPKRRFNPIQLLKTRNS